MTDRPAHPQTIALRAGPGDLLKRGFGPIRPRMVESERDGKYVALVRQLPCLKCGMEPPPNNEAAHVRMQSAAFNKKSGMNKTPPDKFCLPLCTGCHTRDPDSQHRTNEREFWWRVGLNPLLVCRKLFAAYLRSEGNLVVMRAVILTAIAERESASQFQK